MEYAGWAIAALLVIAWVRMFKRYRVADREKTDLHFRQQRLFKEIEVLKEKKSILAASLAQAQQKIRDITRRDRDKRRIQV